MRESVSLWCFHSTHDFACAVAQVGRVLSASSGVFLSAYALAQSVNGL